MNLRTPVRAFALAAVLLMLAATAAPSAGAQVLAADEARAERLADALAAVQTVGPTPEVIAEARAAMADAPAALRTSPLLRDLEEAIDLLDTPFAAALLAPFLKQGAMDDPQAIVDQAAALEKALADVMGQIGLDPALLKEDYEALRKAAQGFDLTSEDAFRASLQARSDEEIRAFMAQLGSFVHRWNETAGTEFTASLDATVSELLRHGPADVRADLLADAALSARYRETASMLERIQRDLVPERHLPEGRTTLSPEDQAAWDGFIAGLRANASTIAHAQQDPFLGFPGLDQYPYDAAAGPVTIDGQPVPGAALPEPPAPIDPFALEGPLDPAAFPAHEPSLAPPPVPMSPREAALALNLPGATPGLPMTAMQAAQEEEEEWVDAPERMQDAPEISIFERGHRGILGKVAAGDARDVYRFTLGHDKYVRIFLQVAEGNADLEVICDGDAGFAYDMGPLDLPGNGRRWSSRSDDTSARPYFDSVTFVHNKGTTYGQTQDPAFLSYDEWACESGSFVLVVEAKDPAAPEVVYYLHGNAQVYDGRPCPAMEDAGFEVMCGMSSTECAQMGAACGAINWARWGDRCKLEPKYGAGCRLRHEFRAPDAGGPVRSTVGRGNHGGYDHEWAVLEATGRENPVVFIHGVGGSYAHMLDMEGDAFYGTFNMRSNKFLKEMVGSIASTAVMIATALHTYKAFSAVLTGAASGSLIGAFAGLAIFSNEMNSWANAVSFILRTAKDVTVNWRVGSADVESHFWTVKDAGYETYWFEYNFGDNNARHGQIKAGSRELKFGLSAIQQDFYDRHKDDAGFPLASPEDVRVDLVVHSMGGLVSRMYTVDHTVLPEGVTYASPVYEADVNKWVSIQTPNMGSSVAKFFAVNLGETIETALIGSALEAAWGSALEEAMEYSSVWLLVKKMVDALLKQFVINWLVKFGAAVAQGLATEKLQRERPELIRGNTQSVVTYFINQQPPAPDVDHGIIYGVPIQARVLGIGRIDLLVASVDAKGPPQLFERMAAWPVKEDHASALFAQPVQTILLQWLANPDPYRLKGTFGDREDIPGVASGGPGPTPMSASIGPSATTGSATVATTTELPVATGHSLLGDFGQKPDAEAWNDKLGATYLVDGGLPAQVLRADPAPLGDRTARLERLAATRNVTGAADLYAGVAAYARESAGLAVTNGSTDAYNESLAAGARLLAAQQQDRALLQRAQERVPDVGVLRSGHFHDAGALLEGRLGEPYALLDPNAPLSAFQQRDVLLVPTGALAGLSTSPFLAQTLDRFVADGGTLVVLAQQRGDDLGMLPGKPRGFGFAEEDASFRGSVTFAQFTPALAELGPRPDLLVDGSFTTLPEGATTLLASVRSGRPVAAAWPHGEGRVVAMQAPADWAVGANVAMDADLRLVRGVLADARAPASRDVGAPGLPLTLDVPVPAVGNATNVTLVLVDAGAKEVLRETFSPEGPFTWALPENVTKAGQHAVDVVFAYEDGTTRRDYDALQLHASRYRAGPAGFQPALAPVAFDATGPDRIETGAALAFQVSVTNREDAPVDFSVQWWFPAHAALDPAGPYGQGPALDGSPAAWEENFRLGANVSVGPNETVVVPVALPAALRADALAARLVSNGEVLAEARRAFTTYAPSMVLTAAPDRVGSAYAPGQSVRLAVSWRDVAASHASDAYSATLRATLRDPHGLLVAAATQPVTVNGQARHANLTLALPLDALPGGYVVGVEALRGAQRVGSAGASLRVSAVTLVVDATLPSAFEAGVPAVVTYALANPGAQPVDDASLTVRLVAPDGAVEWTGSATASVPAGATAEVPFTVVPLSSKLGRYRLVHEATAADASFEGATSVLSSVSARLTFSKTSYRVGDALHAEARLVNDGRWVLPLDATLATDGIPAATASLRLEPGAAHVLPLDGTLPDDLEAGARPVTLSLATPDATKNVTRAFQVPPAQVAVTLDGLTATLANTGGVHATVPWRAQLLDARGLDVLGQQGRVLVPAGGAATLPLSVPAQAATGAYDLRVLAETLPGRPAFARAAVHVDGTAGVLDLAAPVSVAPGATVPLGATPTGIGAVTLENATLTLEAVHPVPLPAWRQVPGAPNATSAIRFGGATWIGTTDGLVRVPDEGAAARIGVADGLPGARVTDLAVAMGRLYVGTDRGLAWLDEGGAWRNLTDLGLPTRHVRALAGTPAALFVGTAAGVARLDGAGIAPVPLPAQAAVDLAADEEDLWVALADVRGGFTGEDAQPVLREGNVRPAPAIAVASNGDVHLAYADNDSTSFSIRHARLSPAGERVSGPNVVSAGLSLRGEPAVGVDRDGNVHVAWHDARDGDNDVYYRKLRADGMPLTPEVPVAVHAGSHQQFVQMRVDSQDRVVLVWQDNRDPNPPGNFVTKSDELWGATLAKDGAVLVAAHRMTESPGYVLRPVLALDAEDNLHAAWSDVVKQCIDNDPDACYPELETFYGKWAPDGAVLVAQKLVSRSDQSMSWLPGLGVGPDGTAVIVYQDTSFGRTEFALSRVDATGLLVTRGVQLTDLAAGPRAPQLLPKADGRFDLVWTDWRTTREEVWHQTLDPVAGKLVGNASRVSSTPEGATGLVARNPRAAVSPAGTLYSAWEDFRTPGKPEVRLAVFEAKLLGRGLARVDLATGGTMRVRAADGVLPSDDVLAVALDRDVLAAATPGALLLRERAAGETFTVPVAQPTALALHEGRAYVATQGRVDEVDPATGATVRLDAGGPPSPVALATVPGGLLVVGQAGAAVHADDRADVLWRATLPATDGAAATASFQAPAETGRLLLRARLDAATGQTLATAARDLFVLDGDLTLTVKPPATPARPGERVPVRVTAANAGERDLKGVEVRLLAGSAPALEQVVSLPAGTARTWVVDVAAERGIPLQATARGAPVELAGLAASATAQAPDWLAVEPAAVSARILAPSVAGRDPLPVDALLSNRGLLPQRLVVSLDGGAPRTVDLPARGRVTVPDLGAPVVLQDAELRLDVRGDAELVATHRVVAGEKVAFTGATGLTGPAGERVLGLGFRNAGPLPSVFPLRLALDGAPLPDETVSLGANAEGTHDATLAVPPGVHALTLATPWETRTLRLVAGDEAVPLLSFASLAAQAGNATAAVRVENAGPGRLAGTLDVDLGFHAATFPVDLAEGANATFPTRASLAGVASGPAEARATLLRNGAAVAHVARAFDVPAPAFRFVAAPTARDADAGEALTFAYTLENGGLAAGTAEVVFTFGGADAQTRRVTLAPGERADLSFAVRVEADATDGTLVARATAPGAEAAVPVRVHGARVLATAAAENATHARGAPGTLLVNVTNPGAAPLDLVARATLGPESGEARFALAPNETRLVPVALRVPVDDEARWTVALASGRALAEGSARFALAMGPGRGVLVSTDRDAYHAGDVVTVTVQTDREGRVDLVGPGFRDAFTLNGTTSRGYALPADLRTGRFAVHWAFDGSGETGSVGIGVTGLEVRSVALAPSLRVVEEGARVDVEWRVRANREMDVALDAWVEDPHGASGDARHLTARLLPGDNLLRFHVTAAGLEPGDVRLAATLSVGRLELASDGANLALRGLALREATVDETAAGTPVLNVETRGDGPVSLKVEALGATVLEETSPEGALARQVPLSFPEPGTYDVRLTVVAGERTMTRDLEVPVGGQGTPPRTTHALEGATFTRADGLPVVSPDHRLRFTATDEGAGVDDTEVRVDGARVPLDGPLTLPPGMHNLTYRSIDKARNAEAWNRLTLLVDGEAPRLALVEPLAGQAHVLGVLVADTPGAPARPDAPTLPDDVPAELWDADGDGHTDTEERVEGSDPADAGSVPARWSPAPPVPEERSVVVVGALRLRAEAPDDETGHATVRVLLDGREVGVKDAAPYEWTLDVGGEAPGDHLLEVVAVDPLGNVATRAVRLLVVPAGPDGLARVDPTDPRFPPAVRALVAWAQGFPDEAGAALARDAAARQARAEGEVDAAVDTAWPLLPPVVTELPGHVEREVQRVEDALDDLDDCGCILP